MSAEVERLRRLSVLHFLEGAMKNENPLPCPFCGSPAEAGADHYDRVACTNPECGAEIEVGDTSSLSEAIAAWNRRASGWAVLLGEGGLEIARAPVFITGSNASVIFRGVAGGKLVIAIAFYSPVGRPDVKRHGFGLPLVTNGNDVTVTAPIRDETFMEDADAPT